MQIMSQVVVKNEGNIQQIVALFECKFVFLDLGLLKVFSIPTTSVSKSVFLNSTLIGDTSFYLKI